MQKILSDYGVTGMKTYKNVKCVQEIKCVKVRALFPENKVRFVRAEQLCDKHLMKTLKFLNALQKFAPL